MFRLCADVSEGFSAEIHEVAVASSFVMEEHVHKHHEFYLLLEGDSKYFINNEILPVSRNQAVFIKSGYIHKASYDNDLFSKRILISFTSDFIGEKYLGLLNEIGSKKLFFLDEYEDIRKIILEIYTEFTNKQPLYAEQCKNLIRELLIKLSRTEVHDSLRKLSFNEIIIQNAAKYISEHTDEDITLHSLASMYAMSDSYFSRTFKQYTGLGISKYIKLTRLRKAEKLLVKGTLSITEIALKCGFNNSNYFISEFKKHKGTTPFKYASLNKENER